MANTGDPPRKKNGFDNPKISSGAKDVSNEFFQINSAKLEEFRRSDRQEMSLPFMTKHQRSKIHSMAKLINFHVESSGETPFRYCVVTKKPPAILSLTLVESHGFGLPEEMRVLIRNYMQGDPIDEKQMINFLEIKPRESTSNMKKVFPRQQPLLVPPLSNPPAQISELRKQLPAYNQRDLILETIRKNHVTLVTGGTGCGKTTQVPQFIMEDACAQQVPVRIICTQPRRLPAIAVAERVAKERGEKLATTVGYHIRLEQRSGNVLTYCTSGVLLRILTQDPLASDISHIILDEIHEREQNTDYLLIALKQALIGRKDLKVILMSATMEGNLSLFMKYFGENVSVDRIDIPSRLYPVEKFFLGDVVALTGYAPVESPYGGCFMKFGSGFDNSFSAFNAVMPAVHTAPNLQTLSDCSNGGAMSGMSASASAASFQQLGAHSGETNTSEPFMKVAAQLANSQQFAQQSDFSSYEHDAYPQGTGFYSQQNGCEYYQQEQYPLQQSGGGPTPDLVNMPTEIVDSDIVEQFQQMHMGGGQPEYSHNSSWNQQIEPQQNWMHTQSFNTIDQSHQMQHSNLQGWHDHAVNFQSSQPEPQFFLPDSKMPQYSSYTGQSLLGGSQLVDNGFNQQKSGFGDKSANDFGFNHQKSGFGGEATSDFGFKHQRSGFGGENANNFGFSGQLNRQKSGFGAEKASTAFGFSQQKSGFGDKAVNEFGKSLRNEYEEGVRMRAFLSNALPNRPSAFVPQSRELLQMHKINGSQLANMYVKCTADQFVDSVDLNLACAVVRHCMDSTIPGAILVFLPGYDDISQMREKLESENKLRQGNCQMQAQLFALHSQINSAEQYKVFESVPPNRRKVILSTNIAEASLTIDDVVFVVDCGKVKEKSYDHSTRISALKVGWIAKSNAEQRSGRAGRVRSGYCFRLYSEEDYDAMLVTQTAEMQRSPIHDVCLHAKMFAPNNMTVNDFLAEAPEPPLPDAISSSMQFLEQLGALYTPRSVSDTNISKKLLNHTSDEPELTDLGRWIALLPLDPQLARLLLFGLALKCLSPVVTLVACLAHREPFLIPNPDQRDQTNRERDAFGRYDFSDHIALIRACFEFEIKGRNSYGGTLSSAQMQFCRSNHLSPSAMKMIVGIKRQLLVELHHINLIRYDGDPLSALRNREYNMYAGSWCMVRAAIVAGSYPGIAYVPGVGTKMRKIYTGSDFHAGLHPSCMIKRQLQPYSKRSENINRYAATEMEPLPRFLVYQEMSKIDEGLTLRMVTAAPVATILMFAGSIRIKKSVIDQLMLNSEDGDGCDDDYVNESSTYEIEPWLHIRGSYENMRLIMQLRFKVMQYFLYAMSEPEVLSNPDLSQEFKPLLETLRIVLEHDHEQDHFNRCELPSVNLQDVPRSWFPPCSTSSASSVKMTKTSSTVNSQALSNGNQDRRLGNGSSLDKKTDEQMGAASEACKVQNESGFLRFDPGSTYNTKNPPRFRGRGGGASNRPARDSNDVRLSGQYTTRQRTNTDFKTSGRRNDSYRNYDVEKHSRHSTSGEDEHPKAIGYAHRDERDDRTDRDALTWQQNELMRPDRSSKGYYDKKSYSGQNKFNNNGFRKPAYNNGSKSEQEPTSTTDSRTRATQRDGGSPPPQHSQKGQRSDARPHGGSRGYRNESDRPRQSDTNNTRSRVFRNSGRSQPSESSRRSGRDHFEDTFSSSRN